MYGSVVELPPLQGKPNGDEHRCGGRIPSSYPPTVSMLGSLTVLQYFTLLPKFLKHTKPQNAKVNDPSSVCRCGCSRVKG